MMRENAFQSPSLCRECRFYFLASENTLPTLLETKNLAYIIHQVFYKRERNQSFYTDTYKMEKSNILYKCFIYKQIRAL